ncbi:MAG: GAF and HD-GYP domain-containing protein [Pseudanabaena sp.]|nr:HD domain-containing protein [Pseudanabaena sp. M090S1SP2A07QC]MCA6508314.1 HD domain-containing protein [Pseudanabaena sp. M172S2SP2A07QC]MCA6520319.1 HD domain-containing protein [Pseudanabaena sp. M051S1SP2A07QC]MCA6527708.1 HD domain-containing protein [Pseudanabaena sp. M179S2SP2A07QC]MCA6530885.1 HD domain-containing protein [Pseudanabaena sp. M125S2SP2A07QC]MCA6534586.1 HD domain-containing protein [Pseudanabaena sp. M176S2SP2A07QC]MCA6538713.1 HD domain-containing protein [Pseudana
MDMDDTKSESFELIEKLNDIGIALSAVKNTPKLLEMILRVAKTILNADGGTLYLATEDKRHLQFEIIMNDSLGIMMGAKLGDPIPFPDLPLYDEAGNPNNTMVAAHAALYKKTINIPDAYVAEGFDFSGPRAFDTNMGYRSKSFLTLPMLNHENELIGVLQLINAKGSKDNQIIEFSKISQRIGESLASQAAIALTNNKLIGQFRELFESFINLMSEAIDKKSPYNGAHCRRVPTLTMMIADAACKADYGIFKDFELDEDERYELKIAGLLHDCGKVTTPVHVIDKATKLETIFDRIHLINTRFEILKRDAEISFLNQKMAAIESGNLTVIPELEEAFQQKLAQYSSDQDFLRICNIGGEFMSDEYKERLQIIATYRWIDPKGAEVNFLTDDEVYNLNISRGTLTAEERKTINDHIVVTIEMLEKLPYPRNLRRVPEYAGGHHERMDGKGYPKGLTREQMSLPARMMGIADIFEALSAKDRPYKKGKTLTECLQILGKMKQGNHIDPDLFDLFVSEKVYLRYANEYLDPDQIDEVDENKIPGYTPPLAYFFDT